MAFENLSAKLQETFKKLKGKGKINEKDLKSPVLASISGNMGKYITRGAKAISHIIFTQIKSK